MASAYKRLPIRACFVGADRIAANGDVANKVGTLIYALLCQKQGIPFYVAAPLFTFDPDCKTGEDIPIEFRDNDEVCRYYSTQTASPDSAAYNPAFDVTPAGLITGFVTEKGEEREII